MKLTAVLVIAALVGCSYGASTRRKPTRDNNATVDCDNIDVMDEAARTMSTFGDRTVMAPLTVNDLHSHFCPKVKSAVATVRGYVRKCFKPFPKQIVGLILYGITRELKKNCETEEGKVFVRHSQCSRGKNHERVHQCADQYVLEAEAIRDTVDNLDMKLPYSCCYYYKFKQCAVRESGNLGCNAAAQKYVYDSLTFATEDALDLICKNYEEHSGNCDTLAPLKTKSLAKSKSFIVPLVDIYTSV
ncbi:hypothetical protein HDE_10464 [Halotydeus destructor]|nr:hypothetical protein HDE_10464 [Halotydeus destructor]